jgi:restriction system protein
MRSPKTECVRLSDSTNKEPSAETSVRVVEDTHSFEAEDGTVLWQIGFVPVDQDGGFLSEEGHRTSDPRCFFCHVAGVSYRQETLQTADLAPGAPVRLSRERDNRHDPNAIAVWDRLRNEQLGYVPAELCPKLLALVPSGQSFDESFGALVLSEFRSGSRSGPRAGLRILIGPVGELMLRVQRDDDDSEDESYTEESLASLEEHAATTMEAPTNAGMVRVGCPACGAAQEAFAGVGGFRCSACGQDSWIIRCRRCREATTMHGSSVGTGSLQFRCSKCRAKNVIDKSQLRAISSQVRRLGKAATAERRRAAADAKAAKAHLSAQAQHEADVMNEELEDQLSSLADALTDAATSQAFSFAALTSEYRAPEFDPGSLAAADPPPEATSFIPPEPRGLAGLVPGAKSRYQKERQAGEDSYAAALREHEQHEQERLTQLAAAEQAHDQAVGAAQRAHSDQQTAVEDLERRFAAADPDAVIDYISAALAALPLPFESADTPRIAFSPDSRQLVLQFALPTIEVIPESRGYRYVKARAEIAATTMPVTERKRRYAALVAQIALLVIDRVFACDPKGVLETVVLNGHVATIDPRTGHDINPCVVTVRTTRDRFDELDLTRVDPVECLKGLTASISRSPAELVPVRPMIDFDMADPRFVKEEDVIATLDTRPNLMELTPQEFESLITNLFEKMGLETRLTQPSRDGGVDCVAYDARPIFGGKVVIQAKRYKNTVGVSAVRDLFGTTQNEGATKGILVTTSGYGQASHEFANGKPLELIDGGNLLYLLHEHAGIEAKIEVPDDWVDPEPPS